MRSDLFFTTIVVLCLSRNVFAQARPTKNTWKVDRVECSTDMCDPLICKILRKNAYSQLINMACYLPPGKESNATRARYELFYRFKRYQKFLLDIDTDVCDFFGNRRVNQPFLNMLYAVMSTHMHINAPCPIDGWNNLTELALDRSYLQGFHAPRGQYRLDLLVYDSQLNASLINAQVYMTISEGNEYGMG